MRESHSVIGPLILLSLFFCHAPSADIDKAVDDASPFNPTTLAARSLRNSPDHYAKFQGVLTYSVTIDLGAPEPYVETGYVFIDKSHAWMVPDHVIEPLKIDPLKMELATAKKLAFEPCLCFWPALNHFQMIGIVRAGRLHFLNVMSWQGAVRGETIVGTFSSIDQSNDPPKPIHGTFRISLP